MGSIAFDHRYFDDGSPPARSTTRAGGRPRWARLEGAPASRQAAGRSAPSRPTRAVLQRRRLATVALLLVAAFAAGVVLALTVLSSPAGGTLTDEARRAQEVRYVVQPGDTLWRVAGAVAPRQDPRRVVDALSDARGTSALRPGEVVVWPPA